MNPKDRELWEYFATLYKNSNKGIKGRGKDRRIVPSAGAAHGVGSRDCLGSDDVKLQRGGYEDSSTYTASNSSDDEDMEAYYAGRRY